MANKTSQLKIYKTNPIKQIKKNRRFALYQAIFIFAILAITIKFTLSCYNFFTKKYILSGYENEFEKVNLIIKYGKNQEINKIENSGQTLLWQACYNNNLNLVKHLIENGAQKSINKTDSYGDTPLWWACFRNNIDLVKYLIDNGAKNSINIMGDCGYTPLEWAYKNNNTSVAKLLIKNGAKIGENSLHNLELMYYACYNGNLKLVKYLVKNQIKQKALEDNLFKIKYLPNEIETEITKKFFEDLYTFCLNKDMNLSSFIISCHHKKIINEKNSFLFTSIYLACVSENLDVVKYLIENYY